MQARTVRGRPRAPDQSVWSASCVPSFPPEEGVRRCMRTCAYPLAHATCTQRGSNGQSRGGEEAVWVCICTRARHKGKGGGQGRREECAVRRQGSRKWRGAEHANNGLAKRQLETEYRKGRGTEWCVRTPLPSSEERETGQGNSSRPTARLRRPRSPLALPPTSPRPPLALHAPAVRASASIVGAGLTMCPGRRPPPSPRASAPCSPP
eukprot:5222749-Pleurochrysis_carterae.AAC.2